MGGGQVFSYAIHDIKKCTKLPRLLEIILAVGNYLNGTGPRGGAYGFKLEVLTKLADTKTADNKSTLLHYIVRCPTPRHDGMQPASWRSPSLLLCA